MMSVELKCLVCWPDHKVLHDNMLSCFQIHFSKVVCTIDCFEVFIECPVAFEAQVATYSNYKEHNTKEGSYWNNPYWFHMHGLEECSIKKLLRSVVS